MNTSHIIWMCKYTCADLYELSKPTAYELHLDKGCSYGTLARDIISSAVSVQVQATGPTKRQKRLTGLLSSYIKDCTTDCYLLLQIDNVVFGIKSLMSRAVPGDLPALKPYEI